jgi:hypothetical protein
MLVAVCLQTTPHVSLRLVTTKCSRPHDPLLKAGATRVGMIMLGFISRSVDELVSESRNAWVSLNSLKQTMAPYCAAQTRFRLWPRRQPAPAARG